MALDKAVESDADLVMGTDPDGDRVGVAIKNHRGEFVLLNGNQTASLLLYYLLKRWEELGTASRQGIHRENHCHDRTAYQHS
jgi:phosphoglucomutase